MDRDNASGADNQQERLDAYIAGFVDGEGTFHVAVQRNPSTRTGWQLVPEFHVSQNAERRQVLDLIQRRLGCGRIQENHRGSKDTTLVFVVRNRQDLLDRVLPFFERQPLVSSKQFELDTFAFIVRSMAEGRHKSESGFDSLRAIALRMNGDGRYRRVHRIRSTRILRGHMPNTGVTGEDMVRSAWRHAEPGRTRNDLAPPAVAGVAVTRMSVPIRCSRRRFEEGCP